MAAGDVQGASGVELREDVPLKGAGSGDEACGACGACGGARGVQACFAALSTGITLALLAQVLGGGGGGSAAGAHGAVSSGAAACSAAGARALQTAGRALDAAAAAALCLTVAAPNTTSLDASGALLLWQYRTEHAGAPTLAQWGAVRDDPDATTAPTDAPSATRPAPTTVTRAPRLLCALAALHAAHGALPWASVIQPTIDLIAAESPPSPEHVLLADYLRNAQRSTSAETAASAACGMEGGVRARVATGARVGRWRVWGASPLVRDALGAALAPRAAAPGPDPLAALDSLDRAVYRAAERLSVAAATDGAPRVPPVVAPPVVAPASGLAVVDHQDTYVALVTGLSADGAAGASTDAGWRYDEPRLPLDLAPAIFAEDRVCGSRLVVGAESPAALAQAGAALLAAGGASAEGVERARLSGAPGALAPDPNARVLPANDALLRLAAVPPLAGRAPAVNVVIQRGDALASHADSRGGGLASRF